MQVSTVSQFVAISQGESASRLTMLHFLNWFERGQMKQKPKTTVWSGRGGDRGVTVAFWSADLQPIRAQKPCDKREVPGISWSIHGEVYTAC